MNVNYAKFKKKFDSRTISRELPYKQNVWFQKISIPPPRRELEIPKGRGGGVVKDPGNSRGKGGCMIDLVSRGLLIQFGFVDRAVQKSSLTY